MPTSESVGIASQDLAEVQALLQVAEGEAAKKRAQYESLKTAVEQIEIVNTEDVIEVPGAGEENYLIGLKVEGGKIGILLDSSSSMTDQRLIDVIRRKNMSDSDKIDGPKWQRSKRIVRWLLARLPPDSEVVVVAFSNKARILGVGGWNSARDASALDLILGDLESVVPSGSTNLQAGLDALNRKRPSNVFLITDGLPTDGDSSYKSLNPFSSCSSLWGGSNIISGECRLKLFHHTLKSSAPRPGVPVNVILLPIEGDPDASFAFWTWTAVTGGLMISPAEVWP